MVTIPATTQAVTQVAAQQSQGVPKVAQAQTLVALTPNPTRAIRAGQIQTLVSAVHSGHPAVSQAQVLVAYKTGGVENLQSRSWTFSVDGHTFYVITLGEQGTFAYDQSTGEWSQFKTEGLTGWNMEIGTTWKGKVIAADQSNPTIWELDPNSFIDDGFKPQTRKASSGLPIRSRDAVANYAFRLTASLGEVSIPTTVPATSPTVQLRFSDDQGKTFVDAGTLALVPNDFVQQLQWISLGSMEAPSRVFEVTDVGAVARIDGVDVETSDEEA